MRERSWSVSAAVAGLIAALIVWTPLPLGVPNEWTWVTIPGSVLTVAAVLGLTVVGVLLIAAVDKSASLYERSRLPSRCVMAAGMVAVIFSWMTVVREPLDWMKTAAGRTRDPWVLYAPGVSGYFSVARDVTNTRDFLAGYEATVDEGDYLHQGTHPPGLILLYRALYISCDNVPALVSFSKAMISEPVQESFAVIAETQQPPLRAIDQAVLWWAAVLTQLTLAATAIPILLLLQYAIPASDAWRLTSLWAFVPAGLVFLPKSDCLYPLVAVSVAWLWVRAMRGKRVTAFLAGFVASCGLWLSLALAPFFAGIGLGSIWYAGQKARHDEIPVEARPWGRLGKMTGIAILGGITPILIGLFVKLNILYVWIGNLRNHAAFYDHNTRTYLAWLPANLLEAAVAAGPTIVALALVLAASQNRKLAPNAATDPVVVRADFALLRSIIAGVAVVWCMLWLSGKNMGEAARLWIFFTPVPLIAMGLFWPSKQSDMWRMVAFLSLLACMAIVLRVDGFDLGGRAIGL